jgi:hypothetical protein
MDLWHHASLILLIHMRRIRVVPGIGEVQPNETDRLLLKKVMQSRTCIQCHAKFDTIAELDMHYWNHPRISHGGNGQCPRVRPSYERKLRALRLCSIRFERFTTLDDLTMHRDIEYHY